MEKEAGESVSVIEEECSTHSITNISSSSSSSSNTDPCSSSATRKRKRSSRLKGPNRNWGNQIYSDQRLGTFRAEQGAEQEAERREEVEMVRSGGNSGDDEIRCKRLFKKDLTRSDVGKLNRVVIPKKYAVEFFPRISEEGKDDVELPFYDRDMKLWKFRYCYWKSSQSFVFTRGWNKFVKEKRLEANDTIMFSFCEKMENNPPFFLIDVINNNDGGLSDEAQEEKAEMGLELNLGLGQKVEDHESNVGAEKKCLKLFGVQISLCN